MKYPAVPRVHKTFLDRVIAGRISPDQLSPVKLERLMDRFAGKEWLPAGLVHLDAPDVEQADVVRGLRTYVAISPEHAARFAALYAKLPEEKQVLPADVARSLQRK